MEGSLHRIFGTEPNRSIRTEPNRTDPDRTDPIRSGLDRPDPDRTDPNRSEPNRSEPNRSKRHIKYKKNKKNKKIKNKNKIKDNENQILKLDRTLKELWIFDCNILPRASRFTVSRKCNKINVELK